VTTQIISPEHAHARAQTGEYNKLRKAFVSEYFSWGEVFRSRSNTAINRCGITIFRNALVQARTMEKIRKLLKAPILVTSWYRDLQTNIAVGGANKSLHLSALATDFVAAGFEGVMGNQKVQSLIAPYVQVWGLGLEDTNGDWTHVDSRGHIGMAPRKFPR
jgi:uncharacterized protein YcbK (DUF882 family)